MTENEYSQLNKEITELRVDVKYIQRELDALRKGMTTDSLSFATKEASAVLTNVSQDHEKRIRTLERYGAIAIALLGVAQFVAPYIIKTLMF